MSQNKEIERTETKYSRICLIIEFLLIEGIVQYYGISHFPEQYTSIGDYLKSFLYSLIFVLPIFYFVFLISSTKKGTIITIILTILIGIRIIVGPIINDYKDPKWKCYDRTTYDNDFNNDLKCINKHGEVKRMEYEDAKNMFPNAVIGREDSDTNILGDKYTEEIYNLVNTHMYNSKGECVPPYNIFDKEKDAYYGYELLDRISKLESQGIEMETDIDDWPHSLDFQRGVKYRAYAKMGYLGCLDGCGMARDTKEYKDCVFGDFQFSF